MLVETMGSIDNHDQTEENAQAKENKKEIGNKLMTRILSLLRNNEEEKPKQNTEVIGLVQEFHKQYQSLYAQYDRLRGEIGKRFRSKKEKDNSSFVPNSDSDFYSSEEIENDITETHDYLASDSETENSELLSPTSTENDKKNRGNERKREVWGSESSSQVKELEEQLSMVQTDLESSRKHNYDLQVQIEEKQEFNAKLQSRVSELEQTLQKKGNEVLELTLKMQKNEKNLNSKIETLTKQMNQNNKESVQFQVLKNEMKSMKEEIAKKTKLEQDLLKEKESVLVQMQDLKSEMNSLVDQKNELEKTITSQTGEAEKLKEEKNTLLKEIDSLVSEKEKKKITEQVPAENPQKETQSQTNSKEIQNQTNSKETQHQANSKEEQHKLEKSQSLDIQKLQKVENNRYRMDNSTKLINHQVLERKISELSDKFQGKMENQIRLLSQRIKVAEHIYNDTSKKVIQKLKQDNKELSEKNEIYETEAKKLAESNIISGMDLMAKKIDEENGKFLEKISRISGELQVAKKWVAEKNDETRKMKQSLERFSTEQDYERTVEDLKNQLEERNEEKKEAIKQLCILTDYHRHRYDQLKQAVSKMPTESKK